jgi:hypothetical protein
VLAVAANGSKWLCVEQGFRLVCWSALVSRAVFYSNCVALENLVQWGSL